MAGALFVCFHRLIVATLRGSPRFKRLVQRSLLIYPFLVTAFISSLTFPGGVGRFICGQVGTACYSNPYCVQIKLRGAINEFFSGFSFQDETLVGLDAVVAKHWHGDNGELWVSLTLFALLYVRCFIYSVFFIFHLTQESVSVDLFPFLYPGYRALLRVEFLSARG